MKPAPRLTYLAPVEKCYRYDELPTAALLGDAYGFYLNALYYLDAKQEPLQLENALEKLGIKPKVPVEGNDGLGCYDVHRRLGWCDMKNISHFETMSLVHFTAFELNLFLERVRYHRLPDALRILVGLCVQQQSVLHNERSGFGTNLHNLLFHENPTRKMLLDQTTAFIFEFVKLLGTQVIYHFKGEVGLSFLVRLPAREVYQRVIERFPTYSAEVTPICGFTTRHEGLGILDAHGISIGASGVHRLWLDDQAQEIFHQDALAYLRRRKLQALIST